MNLIMENWRKYLSEGITVKVVKAKDVSNTLFFMKSPWGVKNNKWDHVGFILSDGKMKDMSGHRWPDQVEPIVSTWQDLMKDKKFWKDTESIPQSPEEAEKMGIYKTMKLADKVQVPDGIICRTNDPEKKAENCGSFVFNVLANAGMDPSFLKSDEYLVVGKQF